MSCVAVIPARRAERTLGATLEALRLGNAAFVERVIVVTSACDPTAALVREWSRRDDRVSLVAAPRPLSAGAARNAGRRAAGDDALLLFVDADCVVAPGDAQRLEAERAARGLAAISARVRASGGPVARLRHILEFKEAASARAPRADWLPPSTTLLCRSAAFDRAGGFPDLWPGEDLVFSQALRDLGERIERSGEVAVRHEHPPGFVEMLRHQQRLGRTAAIARRARKMPGSAFATSVARAWLLLPARTMRIAAFQLREGRAASAWTLLLSPLLLAGLFAWTKGFAAGVATVEATKRDDATFGDAVRELS